MPIAPGSRQKARAPESMLHCQTSRTTCNLTGLRKDNNTIIVTEIIVMNRANISIVKLLADFCKQHTHTHTNLFGKFAYARLWEFSALLRCFLARKFIFFDICAWMKYKFYAKKRAWEERKSDEREKTVPIVELVLQQLFIFYVHTLRYFQWVIQHSFA